MSSHTSNSFDSVPRLPLDSLNERYFHRCLRTFHLFNPLNMLLSKTQLSQLSRDVESGSADEKSRLKHRSAIHLPTNRLIPLPFRFCSFAAAQMFLSTGILVSRRPLPTVFWHTATQLYGSVLNYHNRSTAESSSPAEFWSSLSLAVTSSSLTAVFLGRFIDTILPLSPRMRLFLRPHMATITIFVAATCNVLGSRRFELSRGTLVYDTEGQAIGLSPRAGRRAVFSTLSTRLMTALTVLTGTSLLVDGFLGQGLGIEGKKLFVPRLVVLGCLLVFGMPLTFGSFPKILGIGRNRIEENVRERSKSERFLFYRGL